MKSILYIMTVTLVINFIGSNMFAAEILVYRNESMPWCGTVDKKDAGITVDILNEVTKNGGPKFKFKSLPWKRAQMLVQKNKGTCIIPFTRTATREKHHTWIIELVPNQVRLTIARNPKEKFKLPSPLTLANSKALRIGIIRASALIPTMKELGFTQIIEYNTAEKLVTLLRWGRIDAMAESKWVDNYMWHQIGQKGEDLIAGPNIGEIKYIYLGAALNFPQKITEKIRIAMSKVKKSGALENIIIKWTK